MADKSGIQWTDATWNPTTGCDRVSPGCANCYALNQAPRLQAMAKGRGAGPDEPYMRDGDPKTSGVGFGLMMHESRLTKPLEWTKPRRIFVNSMSDLFHPEVTDEFIDEVFAVMALASHHQFQILTKRPDRMRAYLNESVEWEPFVRMSRVAKMLVDRGVLRKWPLPNVWLGTSVENARWRTRIDDLRATPAAVRFLSCEPLLGPLADPTESWTQAEAATGKLAPFDLTGIDWVIIGGESQTGARKMEEQWVRDIIAACRRQKVAVFVKQMGEVWAEEHGYGRVHAGDMEKFPEDLRVREYPAEVPMADEQQVLAL